MFVTMTPGAVGTENDLPASAHAAYTCVARSGPVPKGLFPDTPRSPERRAFPACQVCPACPRPERPEPAEDDDDDDASGTLVNGREKHAPQELPQ